MNIKTMNIKDNKKLIEMWRYHNKQSSILYGLIENLVWSNPKDRVYVGKGYRRVKAGEELKHGDEYYCDNKWRQLFSYEDGRWYSVAAGPWNYRRKLNQIYENI